MYHPVEIERLSEAQIKKMVSGQPVRVRKGKGHIIHASPEQHKKIHKAHLKGKGITMQMDPYQSSHHHSLIGTGIVSSLKRAYGHAKNAYGQAKSAIGHASKFYGEHKEMLDPYADILKRQATHKVERIANKAQPLLTRHLGEIGTHLGEDARAAALHNINTFGEPAHNEESPIYPAIESAQDIEETLGGRLKHTRRHMRRHIGHGMDGGGMSGYGMIGYGKPNIITKVAKLAKTGFNTVTKKAMDYAKSPAGRALIQRGLETGVSLAMGAGIKKHHRRHRGGALLPAGGALLAAGSSYL